MKVSSKTARLFYGSLPLLIGCLLFSDFVLAQQELRYWYRNYDSPHSFEVLAMALEKTEDLYGKTRIRRSEELTQGRAVALLKDTDNHFLDVINFVPDGNRIEHLMPVYIAVEEGLVGQRVCIIRKGKESLFEGVRTLSDMQDKGITIGQGAHWPDREILEANSLDVMSSVSYEDLFAMLERGRFDCYLRGAHEAIDDLVRYRSEGKTGLMIEPRLLFVYPSASFFFVARDNASLAVRIELGLRRAIVDGDYQKLFRRYYDDYIKQLKLHDRRVIRLNNTLLNDEILAKSTRRKLLIDGKIDN